jgi:hypothetical protein
MRTIFSSAETRDTLERIAREHRNDKDGGLKAVQDEIQRRLRLIKSSWKDENDAA